MQMSLANHPRPSPAAPLSKGEGRTLFNLQFAICGCQFAIFLLLFAFLPGCKRGVNPKQAEQFQAAQKAFDAAEKPEEFVKVAAMYEELLDPPNNFISGELSYDLGNAWMRAKQPGRAIAAYRQAQRYLPREEHLKENLREALKAEPDAGRPILETVVFWQNWLSYPEKFYLASGAIAMTLLLATVLLFVPRRSVKRLVLVLAVFSVIAIFSALYDAWRFDYVEHGVTIVSEVVARKGNAETFEPALTENLPEGTEFRLVDRRPHWFYIRLAGGQEGWIPEAAAVIY